MNPENNAETLQYIEIAPKQAPVAATLIWLHGLGATCEDFVPLAPELGQLTGLPLRFVFPQAPLRPVTINNGYVMPAWYDILSFEKSDLIDHEGISISVNQIKALIAQEKERGFANHQIFLAGFSQGAVIALQTFLAYPEKLGGVIALSGYLTTRELPSAKNAAPLFMGHGLADEVVPCIYGQASYETLKQAGYSVSWHAYPMPHSVCDQEVRDIAAWINTVIDGHSRESGNLPTC